MKYAKYYKKFITGPTPFDLELERIRFNHIEKTVNFHQHKHILDVGSGPYAGFNLLSEWETYTVVEPISEFCDILRKSAIWKENVCIINSTLEESISQLKSNKYDCVILSSVLHLVKEDIVFLDLVHSICAERNIVHINVPNKRSIHRVLGEYMRVIDSLDSFSEKDIEYSHKHLYDLRQLIDLVAMCGFDVRHSGSYLIKPFDEEKMSRIVDRHLMRGLELMIEEFPSNGCEIFVEAKAIK